MTSRSRGRHPGYMADRFVPFRDHTPARSPTPRQAATITGDASEPLNLRAGECVPMGVSDEEEAAAFCDRMRLRLVGSLTLACGDRGVAEELAQDALVRVWERWDRVSSMDAPEAWLYRTAFNLASSWRRRRLAEWRANRRSAPGAQLESAPDVAEVEVVRQAVVGLPKRQRAVVVARYYLGYDVAGTAELLGCAPGTVKAATHQALANLRRSGLQVERAEEVAP